MARGHKQSALINSEALRRTGVARCDAPEYVYPSTGYWAVRDEVCRAMSDPAADGDDAEIESRNERLYAVLNDILACRAKTTEGQKIQARAVALAAADLWDGLAPENDHHERQFIEATRAFFGMNAKQIALAL